MKRTKQQRIEILEGKIARQERWLDEYRARANELDAVMEENHRLRAGAEAPQGMVLADVIRWLEAKGYKVEPPEALK
jgi:hypothetical protein